MNYEMQKPKTPNPLPPFSPTPYTAAVTNRKIILKYLSI